MDWVKLLGMPINAAAHGARVDSMMGMIHVIMAVLFIGWGFFFIFCLVRFRKGANPTANYHGVRNHYSSYIEGAIAIVEAVILVALAFPIWSDLKAEPPSETDPNVVVVSVIAQQFAWNIHYPGADNVFGRRDINLVKDDNVWGLDRTDPAAKDDIVTINQLNLPVGKQALIKLTSQDVIHSLYLPQMRVKQDAIPGMEIPVYFTPIATGNWEIACAQLCGLGHYRMRGFYNVQSEADYAAWMAEQVAEQMPEPEAAPEATPVEGEAAPAGDGAASDAAPAAADSHAEPAAAH